MEICQDISFKAAKLAKERTSASIIELLNNDKFNKYCFYLLNGTSVVYR